MPKPYSETALVMMARECRAQEPEHFFFAALSPSNLRGLVVLRLDRRTRKVTPEMMDQAQRRFDHETRGHSEQTIRECWQHTSPWYRVVASADRVARVPAETDPVWRRVAKRLA